MFGIFTQIYGPIQDFHVWDFYIQDYFVREKFVAPLNPLQVKALVNVCW